MIQIFIVLFLLSFFYLGWRLIQPAGVSRRSKILLWAGLLAGFGIMIAEISLNRGSQSPSVPLSWAAYVLLGLLSFVFFLLLLRDIWLMIAWVARNVRGLVSGKEKERQKQTAQVDKERRAHLLQLTNIGVVGVAGAITSYGIFEARKTPGIVNIEVPIDRLPKAFDGFRIVQITDVHAGLTVGREWIENVAKVTQSLNPDMIAFTGDLADGSVPNLRHAVAPLGDLHAPFGKFFVTGNHEYYSGAEQWVAEARRLGYDVLMNEHRIIERNGARMVIGGVTDFTGGRFLPSHRSDPEAAFRNAPSDTTRIFLAHQPKTLRQTASVDFDLMLSGHTHGGQFFPWHLATALDQPYLSGLHRPDGKWIYVSKGTAYWGPPVRVGARSEITVITLKQG